MKNIVISITFGLLLSSCTKNLTDVEKIQILNLAIDGKMDLSKKEEASDACVSSFFKYSDYKVNGDTSSAIIKMSYGGTVLLMFNGTKSLETAEGCNNMKNEFAKLKGNDAKFDIVEVSWNNKTGKGIAKKLIASKVD